MSETANEIDISSVRKDELEDMLRVLCTAFQMPFESALPIFLADTNSLLDNKRVLRQDGKIVSCLTIIPAECNVRGVSLRTAGIAGVATRPDKRAQGYASQLLRNTLAYCRDQGYERAGLFPSKADFYRKNGFATVSRSQSTTFLSASDSGLNNDVQVRMAIDSDLKYLQTMDRESTLTKAVSLVRNEAKWQSIFSSSKRILVAESSDKIVGYLIYDFILGQNTSIVCDSRTPLMARILEIESPTEAAYSALLNHCTVHSGAEHFHFITDRTGIARFRAVTGRAIPSEDEHAAVGENEFMLTILDFRAVISKIIAGNAAIPARSISITLELIDNEKGNECVVMGALSEAKSFGTYQPEQAPDKPASVIAGDMAAWTQVIAGYYDGSETSNRGMLRSTSEGAAKILKTLFPPEDPFISMLDNF